MSTTRSMAKKACYDFSIGEERQRFCEDAYNFAMTWCNFELAEYLFNPTTNIFLVKNGPNFLPTMNKLWHDKVRLIPIMDSFLIKIKGQEYFQFTIEEYPKVYDDKITFDLEDYVMTTLENWVMTGKYQIILTGELPYSFHAHCIELLYRGIHYIPKKLTDKSLELEILNYYGPKDPIYHA